MNETRAMMAFIMSGLIFGTLVGISSTLKKIEKKLERPAPVVVTNAVKEVSNALPPLAAFSSIVATNAWVPGCLKCGSPLETEACPDGLPGCAVFHARCPKCSKP